MSVLAACETNAIFASIAFFFCANFFCSSSARRFCQSRKDTQERNFSVSASAETLNRIVQYCKLSQHHGELPAWSGFHVRSLALPSRTHASNVNCPWQKAIVQSRDSIHLHAAPAG
jgi:hypothetical protein